MNDADFATSNYKETTQKIFGDEYTAKLYKMFEAVLYLLKPNGEMPQIGDNDSGQLHKLSNRNPLDMRYLLTLGAVFFHEPKFKIQEFGFCEEATWLLGEQARKTWDNLKEHALADIKSKSFPEAGWHIMRDNKNYMLISCGPNDQNDNGGHCHNDKLSFELCVNGEDAIVDPGTYVYTSKPEWRNHFRSTQYHNTVMVDTQEQNRIINNNRHLFTIKNDAKMSLKKWETGEEYDYFCGEHNGYTRFKSPVIHQREIKFYKGGTPRWEITDKFIGEGEHDLQWNLIFPPSQMKKITVASDKLTWKNEKAFYSPEYGINLETQKLSAHNLAQLPCEFKFSITLK